MTVTVWYFSTICKLVIDVDVIDGFSIVKDFAADERFYTIEGGSSD